MPDSEIVYQNIDEEFPIAGQDNDSQGFRDNFSEIKNALSQAKIELTDLLTNAAKLDEDNNFNQFILRNGSLLQISKKVYNTGNINSNSSIQWSDASYQNVTVTADVVLTLGGWPTQGNLGHMRLALRSDGSARTVTIDADNAGTIFKDPNWPVSGTLTVNSSSNPVFVDAWSSDGGASVFLEYKGQFTLET